MAKFECSPLAAGFVPQLCFWSLRSPLAPRTGNGLCSNRLRAHVVVRACNLSESSETEPARTASTENAKSALSKTEKIAAMLGQDKAVLEERSRKVKEDDRKKKRRSYVLALGSIAVGVGLFFGQRSDPNSSIKLMEYLRTYSDPVEVVGTNGLPTVIEFSANWCENCKFMSRRVFELKGEYGGRVNFVVVDGDDPARGDIIDSYGVDAIPQFSLVDAKGVVLTNLIGLIPKQALSSDLDAILEHKPLPYEGLNVTQLKGND